MKEIYPTYADRVNFIAVGIDPTEGPEVLRAYRESEGYPWEKFLATAELVEDYRVVSTAIKYAVDERGVITFHGGYGVESAETWEAVFEELVRGS